MPKVRRIDQTTTHLTWQQATADFIAFKTAQGLSDTTINDYKEHLNRFFKRFPDCWPENIRPAVLEYLSDNIAPATYNIRLEYLKVFFGFCLEEKWLSISPTGGLKRRRDEGKVRQIDTDTLTQLLKLPNQHTFSGLRDYCLLLLTLDTGIRPGEALKLTLDDIDLAGHSVTVSATVSKTRRMRTLPISPHTAKAIRKLINARHPEWDYLAPLFCSFEGKPFKRNGWYQRIAIYSDKLGVKIRPYDLRHSFAILYLKNGGHAFGLQRTLGHSDMQMTKRYVNLTNSDLADVHKVASPLGRLLEQGQRIRKINGKR